MRDHRRFEFRIYYNGAHFAARVRGQKRYLLEKAFLEDLVAPATGGPGNTSTVPHSTSDFYMLDKKQLAAYSAFRRETYRSERGFPAKTKKTR